MREGSKKKCWIFELIVEHTLDLIQKLSMFLCIVHVGFPRSQTNRLSLPEVVIFFHGSRDYSRNIQTNGLGGDRNAIFDRTRA